MYYLDSNEYDSNLDVSDGKEGNINDLMIPIL